MMDGGKATGKRGLPGGGALVEQLAKFDLREPYLSQNRQHKVRVDIFAAVVRYDSTPSVSVAKHDVTS